MKRFLSAFLGLVFIFSLLSGCGPAAPVPLEGDVRCEETPSAIAIAHYDSYSEIYKHLKTAWGTNANRNDALLYESGTPTPTESSDMAASSDCSGTNVQVSGIDEADIVKTDGEYIYAVGDGELVIYSAAGTDSAVVSRTGLGGHCYPRGLYIEGDRLVVLSAEYSYPEGANAMT